MTTGLDDPWNFGSSGAYPRHKLGNFGLRLDSSRTCQFTVSQFQRFESDSKSCWNVSRPAGPSDAHYFVSAPEWLEAATKRRLSTRAIQPIVQGHSHALILRASARATELEPGTYRGTVTVVDATSDGASFAEGDELGRMDRSVSLTVLPERPAVSIETVRPSVSTGSAAEFRVTRESAGDRTLSVRVRITSDGVRVSSRTVTVAIPAGWTSAVHSVSVPSNSPPGTITATLQPSTSQYVIPAAPGNAATVVVADRAVSIEPVKDTFGHAVKPAGQMPEFTVTASRAHTAALTVNLLVTVEGATATRHTVVIPANQTSATYTHAAIYVPLPYTDGRVVTAEVLPGADYAPADGDDGSAELFVYGSNYDDSVNPRFTLSVDPYYLAEDGGAREITVTAYLGRRAPFTGAEVDLRLIDEVDDATYGTDYTSSMPRSVALEDRPCAIRYVEGGNDWEIVIPPGRRSGSATFTFTPVNDRRAEGMLDDNNVRSGIEPIYIEGQALIGLGWPPGTADRRVPKAHWCPRDKQSLELYDQLPDDLLPPMPNEPPVAKASFTPGRVTTSRGVVSRPGTVVLYADQSSDPNSADEDSLEYAWTQISGLSALEGNLYQDGLQSASTPIIGSGESRFQGYALDSGNDVLVYNVDGCDTRTVVTVPAGTAWTRNVKTTVTVATATDGTVTRTTTAEFVADNVEPSVETTTSTGGDGTISVVTITIAQQRLRHATATDYLIRGNSLHLPGEPLQPLHGLTFVHTVDFNGDDVARVGDEYVGRMNLVCIRDSNGELRGATPAGDYIFSLTVTDPDGLSDTDIITVTVGAEVEPPEVTARSITVNGDAQNVALVCDLTPDDGRGSGIQCDETDVNGNPTGRVFSQHEINAAVDEIGRRIQKPDSLVQLRATSRGSGVRYSWRQVCFTSHTVLQTGLFKFKPDGKPAPCPEYELVNLRGANGSSPSFTTPSVRRGEVKHLYFEVTGTDSRGNTGRDSVWIQVEELNWPPSADAGPNQLVAEGERVTLDGSNSCDPRNANENGCSARGLSFQWEQFDNGAPMVALANANSSRAYFTAPRNLAGDVFLSFKLTVNGVSSESDDDFVMVEVRAQRNIPPTADTGEWPVVDSGETFTLDGSGSTAPGGDALTYQWNPPQGALIAFGVTSTDLTAARLTLTAPEVVTDTIYPWTLTVTRATPASDSATGLSDTARAPVLVRSPRGEAHRTRPVVNRITVSQDPDTYAVTLTGDVTHPLEGRSDVPGGLSYQWTHNGGNNENTFGGVLPYGYENPFVIQQRCVDYDNRNQPIGCLQEGPNVLTEEVTKNVRYTLTVYVDAFTQRNPLSASGGITVAMKVRAQKPLESNSPGPQGQRPQPPVRDPSPPPPPFLVGSSGQAQFPGLCQFDPETGMLVCAAQSAGESVVNAVDAPVTPPTACAGQDLTGAPGESVTLEGTCSTNPYGQRDLMTHAWSQTSGPPVTLSDATRGDPTFTIPADAAGGTTLVFELTVTDETGRTDSDTATVTVVTPPTACAGKDLTGAPGETVTLQGQCSTNPYGPWHSLAHAWTQLSGPEVTLNGATSGAPSFTIPADAADGTTLVFELTVTDRYGESASDTATVTVVVPPKTTACAGQDLTGAPGATVTLQGRCSTNPYGKWHHLAHAWTQLSGPKVTLNGVNRGDPSFTIPANAPDGTTLVFQLAVTDQEGQTDTDTVTVTVDSTPEPTPPTACAGDDLEAQPGDEVTLQGTCSTNPHGVWWRLAHLWTQPEGQNIALSDATKGKPTFTMPTDAAPGTVYTFTLTVTDKDGESDSDSMTVSVPGGATGNSQTVEPPANRAPVFSDESGLPRSIAENTAAGTNVGAAIAATDPDDDTVKYSLSGTDAASFAIDEDSGQITTVAGVTYDFETKNSYTLAVNANDGNGGTASIAVTVSLTNVNEAPAFSQNAAAFSLAENTAGGVNVGSALTAADPEGDALTYSLSGTDATSFAIDGAGQLSTVDTATYDYETQNRYSLTVSAADGKGGTASIAVTVNLTDVDETPEPPPNRAPVFDDGSSATRSVAENSAAGVNVGDAITATDLDGDTLAYSLSGTDAGSFAINRETGQLTTKSGVDYDYETKSSYALIVSVSDGRDGTASIAVTVKLTDVAEATPVTACFTNLGTLTSAADYAGSWNDANCKAHHQDSLGRYIHFTLSEETTVSISLSAGALYVSKDTPNNGWGTAPKGTYEHRKNVRRGNGKLVHDGSNSATLTLAAGETYTVEAAGASGEFTLSIAPQ